MKLTPKIIENIYAMLYCVEPFSSWELPLPEEVKFIVDADPDVMGTYLYDDGETHAHTITISSARCGHLDTVIRTMAHEMIHASRWNTVTHAFRNRAKAVANELGFDPLEL
jgi:hypothetical protein